MAKTKVKKAKIWQVLRPHLLAATLFILLVILLILTYEVIFMDKYFPRTLIGDSEVSLMTKAQATRILSAKFAQRANQQLQVSQYTLDLATASAKLDYSIIDQAFGLGHAGSLPKKLKDQFKTLIFSSFFRPAVSFNIDKQLDQIAASVYKAPQDAQLIFDETTTEEGSPSANIQIKEAKDGLELDQAKLHQAVEDYLIFGEMDSTLSTKIASPKITTDHVKKAKQALESSQTKPVKLLFADKSWVIDIKQLLTLLDLTSGQNLLLDQDKTYTYLKKISNQLDQAVQEGLFEFNPQTRRVTAFQPSGEGRKLDIDKTYLLITAALTYQQGRNITLPVAIVKPKIHTSDVNSLGIRELMGRGVSHFTGSIPNRIYNIQLAASRINGILIPPGEIFSFNEKVGDISAQSGYKQAYVIKSGRTVLDDGGGVCQDSTTLFRAVLNAGLPIIQRVAHAYRVGFYEQGFPPGLDATVWAPSVDFKFKNDTPAHILIQAYTLGNTLSVDLYGTSDGRIATVSRPVVQNLTPPPPDLRQDDPTLPKGTVKQVDFAAWGAQVSFSRTVVRGNDTLIKEVFKSNFRPWQAIYLVGTKE